MNQKDRGYAKGNLIFRFQIAFVTVILLAMVATGKSLSVVKEAHPKLTGIFSNLSYHDSTGDVNGIEIILVLTSKGYCVVVQSSEGEPNMPVVAKASIVDSTISFNIESETGFHGIFSGVINSSSIIGQFQGGIKLSLKKGKSYWQ